MLERILVFSRGVKRGLSSRLCWRIIVWFFLVEALWFVFSAQYPMAFDENYHFGLIQLHAHQWLPFFTSQPPNAAVYGAVWRDPSYLYHWLMSYPYRLISLFTHDQTIQVIFLRIINVALFAYGITLYRRIVRRIGVSRPLTNAIFAIFVLIPVVPFLAAHINYDNLFFVVVPLSTLLTLRLMSQFSENKIDAVNVLVLFTVLCLASLIKYPFLPVFAVIGIFLLWQLWRAKLASLRGLRSFLVSFVALSWLKRIVLVLLCLVAVGLFAERYITNTVTYHNPVPACNVVISEDECIQYGPYGRDHFYMQEKPVSFHANTVSYLWQWLYGMWYRLFFAINYDYATAPPLFVIAITATIAAVLLIIGIGLKFRWLFVDHPTRQLLLWITVGYVLVLFADGYSSYVRTAQPVAINGRYLIPFLPFLFAFGGLAWSQMLGKRAAIKAVAASLVIAIFLLQGGGATTFLIRSSDTWMWNNSMVRTVNRTLRSIAWPFIPGKGLY